MSEPATALPFLDRTFEEALGLLIEARDYLAERQRQGSSEQAALQLAASCETMRLTARLTQIMAWLLVQKAVHAGEMTRDQAAQPEHRLGGREVCTLRGLSADMELPQRLQRLLDRSLNLYVRIARLDELVGRAAAAPAGPAPHRAKPSVAPDS